MNIVIDWMEGWMNSPRFIIKDVDLPKRDGPYERRNGLHRRNNGDFVDYFYTDGKPTNGYGGARFHGTLTNGEPFEYIGAWSSRAACVNEQWPEDPIVDVIVGHRATAIRAQAIIDWWRDALREEHPPAWGLAWVTDSSGEKTLQPTRDGDIKDMRGVKNVEHINGN